MPALLSTATGTVPRRVVSRPAHARTDAGQAEALMEVAPTQQRLGDSFSSGWLTKRGARAPSLDGLVADADLGHSFGSSRSFIDMDPAELFSMRWTGTAPPESDFDFGLIPGGGSDPPSPVLVSASRVIRDGRLLRSDPGLQERAADPPSAPRSPLLRSRSTPVSPSPSPCSSGRTAGRTGGGRSSSSWKILLQYLRFLMPLYRKVRALRRFPAPRRPRPRVAPASPARASTSSLEWCHGNADTAVRDAILYCKKSSVRPTSMASHAPPIAESNQTQHAHRRSLSAMFSD